MRYVLWSMMAMATLCPSSAIGQEPPQARPGDRIRVTAPDCGLGRETATLASIEGGVLSATDGGSELCCPLGSVTTLETSTGVRLRGWKPVLIGVGIGAGIPAAYMVAYFQGGNESDGDSAALGAALLMIGGVGIGLIAGAIVGLTHTEGWQEVPVPVQPFGFMAADGRAGLGLSLPLRR